MSSATASCATTMRRPERERRRSASGGLRGTVVGLDDAAGLHRLCGSAHAREAVRGPLAAAEMRAEGTAAVVLAEQAARPQDRQHELHEVVEPGWQMRRADVEAIGRAVLEPVLDRVRHLLRAADGQEVAATTRD